MRPVVIAPSHSRTYRSFRPAAVAISWLVAGRMPAIVSKPLAGPFWNGLHGTAADLTVVLLAVHLGLNWRWIASVSRRLFGRNPMRRGATGGDAL